MGFSSSTQPLPAIHNKCVQCGSIVTKGRRKSLLEARSLSILTPLQLLSNQHIINDAILKEADLNELQQQQEKAYRLSIVSEIFRIQLI